MLTCFVLLSSIYFFYKKNTAESLSSPPHKYLVHNLVETAISYIMFQTLNQIYSRNPKAWKAFGALASGCAALATTATFAIPLYIQNKDKEKFSESAQKSFVRSRLLELQVPKPDHLKDVSYTCAPPYFTTFKCCLLGLHQSGRRSRFCRSPSVALHA